MSAKYAPHGLRRLHQLSATSGGVRPVWSLNSHINFKFSDMPQSMTALGRRFANTVPAIRLVYSGIATSTGGCVIPRKVLTPMLCSSVQVQGTEIGTPVSSSHMLGGLIDQNSYYRSGCRNNLFNQPGITLAAATPKAFVHTVDIYLANFSQAQGWQTAPLALFLQPGEMTLNAPAVLASVHASLTDVTLSALSVTAHARIIPNTEIIIPNPWQMTRHKTTAGNGADSVQINSFGASSTLTGVQTKAGIGMMLWAGSGVVGSPGPGTVASITQFAADFLGLRQNNDPYAILEEMFDELTLGEEVDTAGVVSMKGIYPYFDLQHPAVTALDLQASAEYFPIIPPTTDIQASKLLDAVGNPSYDLTGTFTPGASHYTICDMVYPFTLDKLNDLLAVVQRSHLGIEIYGTDDLTLDTKMADLASQQNAEAIAIAAPSKFTYLPRRVVPRAIAAAK
jgi:hypothetical protein